MPGIQGMHCPVHCPFPSHARSFKYATVAEIESPIPAHTYEVTTTRVHIRRLTLTAATISELQEVGLCRCLRYVMQLPPGCLHRAINFLSSAAAVTRRGLWS